MLKELLPKLKPRLKLSLKLKPANDPHLVEEEQPSPSNLLDSFESDSSANSNLIHQFITSLRIFILALPIIFVGSLFLNDFLEYRVNRTQESINNLTYELEGMYAVKSKSEQVYRKVEILKSIKNPDPFSARIAFMASATPENIKFSSLRYAENAFKIKATVPRALDISLLINNYFENPSVDAISLLSAELEQGDGGFKVELEVLFR
jgi:hypothetical protein